MLTASDALLIENTRTLFIGFRRRAYWQPNLKFTCASSNIKPLTAISYSAKDASFVIVTDVVISKLLAVSF